MKIDVRHSLPCSVERFWQLYWDDGFDEQLRRHTAVKRELLSETWDGKIRVRRVRFSPQRELPAPIAAILGAQRLAYEQENRFDQARNEMRWTVLPSLLPGRLTASGRFRIEEDGDDSCVLRIDGDIIVAIPFVGGQVEKAIVTEIERSYSKLADTVRTALTEG